MNSGCQHANLNLQVYRQNLVNKLNAKFKFNSVVLVIVWYEGMTLALRLCAVLNRSKRERE